MTGMVGTRIGGMFIQEYANKSQKLYDRYLGSLEQLLMTLTRIKLLQSL